MSKYFYLPVTVDIFTEAWLDNRAKTVRETLNYAYGAYPQLIDQFIYDLNLDTFDKTKYVSSFIGMPLYGHMTLERWRNWLSMKDHNDVVPIYPETKK